MSTKMCCAIIPILITVKKYFKIVPLLDNSDYKEYFEINLLLKIL